ncbi:MAG: hypothetical protein AB8G26_17550 [Ilumatobacter sp.]
MTEPASGSDANIADVRRRLGELEAASDQRRAELRAVLDDVPAALSRRRLVASAVSDLRAAPRKLDILRRGAAKVGRLGAPRS